MMTRKLCVICHLVPVNTKKVIEASGRDYHRAKRKEMWCVCAHTHAHNGDSIPRRGPIPSICAVQDKLWLGTGIHL